MIGEECALEFFSKDLSHEAKAKDSTLKAKPKAKTKDFKIVLEGPRGRGLVLEDSKTVIWYQSKVVMLCGQEGNGLRHTGSKIGVFSTPKTDMAEKSDDDAVTAAIMHSYSCKW